LMCTPCTSTQLRTGNPFFHKDVVIFPSIINLVTSPLQNMAGKAVLDAIGCTTTTFKAAACTAGAGSLSLMAGSLILLFVINWGISTLKDCQLCKGDNIQNPPAPGIGMT
jgi:hypothetical protein